MKKLVAAFVALAFAAGTAGFALAQQPAKPAAEEKMDKAGEKKAPAKKVTIKSANGTVKSAAADSVVVAGKEKGKDAEWTFVVDPKTKIKKAGKDVTAADLKQGDAVQVRYAEHDGKAMAQAITVKPGKSMEKKAAANPCAAKPAEKSGKK